MRPRSPKTEADEVRESYEPFIEAQQGQQDGEVCRQLCENVRGLLMRADWREQMLRSRQHGASDRAGFSPLAEVMLAAQSLGVVESINRVHELARAGSLRSAMDEAYDGGAARAQLPAAAQPDGRPADRGQPRARGDREAVGDRPGVRRLRGEVAQATKMWRRITSWRPWTCRRAPS